jgi:serine/threonine-protein kinase HipA
MRRRLAAMRIEWAGLDAVDRLALVGRHGRGALIFEPATTPSEVIDAIDLDLLAEQSRRILLGEESDLTAALAELGGASGGARPKIHVGFDPRGGACVADGEVAQGFEPWIVKFRATADPEDIGPIEQAYAQIARAAGVIMSETRLIQSRTGPGYFATRRFDRPAAARRLHMVSLSGAIEAPAEIPGAIDYDMFLRATRHITRDVRDVEQAFVRMVFNILACNRDDHSRQHAYLMDHDGRWRLAPAYDLTYSAGPGGEHYLAIANEGRTPRRQHVDMVAKAHGIAKTRTDAIVEQARDAIAGWSKAASDHGVGTHSRAMIVERLEQIAQDFA